MTVVRAQGILFSLLTTRRSASTCAQQDTTSPPDAIPTSRSFKDLKPSLHLALRKALAAPPFEVRTMMPIQDKVLSLIPVAATHAPFETRISYPQQADPPLPVPSKDLLIKSRTGTGKTLAYLLLAAQARLDYMDKLGQGINPHAREGSIGRIVTAQRKWDIGALILVPTRQLAMQVAKKAAALLEQTDLHVSLFVAKSSPKVQLKDFRKNTHDVVIATPARLVEVMKESREMRDALKRTRLLILDEADQLLRPVTATAVNELIDGMSGNQQTFLVSATLPEAVQEIAAKALRPDHELVDSTGVDAMAPHGVIPQYVTVAPRLEDAWLHLFRLLAHDALTYPDGGKALIFVPSGAMAKLVAEMLLLVREALPWSQRMHVLELSAGQGATKQEMAADLFSRCKGGYAVLVTTDLSARGIDYEGVTRVIQFMVPRSRSAYLHRIGRTARAGRPGRADLILLEYEKEWLHDDPFAGQHVEPLTVAALEQEVASLAQQPRQSEALSVSDRHHGRLDQQGASMPSGVAQRLDELEAHRQTAMRRLQPQTLQSAFNSLVGYYAMRTGQLRRRMPTLLKQLVSFACEACGYAGDPIEQLPNALRRRLDLPELEARPPMPGAPPTTSAVPAAGRATRSTREHDDDGGLPRRMKRMPTLTIPDRPSVRL